jgi:hypothetical protein
MFRHSWPWARGIMTQVMHLSCFRWSALYLSLCSVCHALESVDPLKKALTDPLSIQMEIAISQKHFSIMSRALPEKERCVARELLGASIGLREVTTHA